MRVHDHPLYETWRGMRKRCYAPYHNRYKYYGALGVRMCARWYNDFWAFVADVGDCPAPGMSLDRLDGKGHYEPGNVKWSTATEQARNRRNGRYATINGETKLVIEWCEEFGAEYLHVMQRLNKGWGIEAALYMPKGVRKGSLESLCREAWQPYLDVYAKAA